MAFPMLKYLGIWSLILACGSIVSSKVVSNEPEPNLAPPAGLKLFIDGNIYSFTTDVCSGGVFFKDPVLVRAKCIHGYFLARPDGCSIKNNSIIGGEKYACQSAHHDQPKLAQAFIPVTNPENPLDHTITLYDDPDTLKNFRRYTFHKIKAGKYLPSTSEPTGAIVVNSQKTQKLNIDNLCYEGTSQIPSSAHMARLKQHLNEDHPAKAEIAPGCNNDSIPFPWDEKMTFKFLKAYSNPEWFAAEIKAQLPSNLRDNANQNDRIEIWGGLAYCLQAIEKVSSDGKIKMEGLKPSIKALELFCPFRGLGALNKTLNRKKDMLRDKRQMFGWPIFPRPPFWPIPGIGIRPRPPWRPWGGFPMGGIGIRPRPQWGWF